MVKVAQTMRGLLPAGPYSRFAWAFTAGFLITLALGWSLAFIVVAFAAAVFARIFKWIEVYLMAALAILIMIVFFAFLAIGAGKFENLATDLGKDFAWMIATASATYLGLVVSIAAALYMRVFLRRA